MLPGLKWDKHIPYFNRAAVRAAKRAKKKRLMKEIFGYDVVRSDYLAFDPFHDFGVTPYPIASKNRHQVKVGSSGYPRKHTRVSVDKAYDTPLYIAAPGVNRRGPFTEISSKTTTTSLGRPDQTAIRGFIHDTTKESRGSISDHGEAEMFLPRIRVPVSKVTYVKYEAELAGADMFGPYHRIDRTTRTLSGTCARITQAEVDKYLTLERAKFTREAPSAAERLLADALPTSRSFGFLREIIELKDLPRTIQSSVQTVREGVRGVFDPSSAFLNKEFGWDMLAKAAVDLVELPDKIAKRVNYLLERQGQPTTFRSRLRGSEYVGGAGQFTFDPLIDESLGVASTAGFRNWEFRLALNYNVKFPKLELPKLREYVSSQLWGAKFRVDDFYNLIPWTWLVDWFAGLGDYLEAVASVNADTSIANYGFLTYASQGWLAGVVEGELTGSRSTRHNGGPIVTTGTKSTVNHEGFLRYHYLNRVDVTSLSDIKRSWVFDDLSLYQASILAAITTRGGH